MKKYFRIKSLRYNTYYTGGTNCKNPDFKETLEEPLTKWDKDPKAWEEYWSKRRAVYTAFEAAKKDSNIPIDDYEALLKLMKEYNVDHDYVKFDYSGKVFNSKQGASAKLSNLTKTTAKIRSKSSTNVLFGNELSANWKVVPCTLIDDET